MGTLVQHQEGGSGMIGLYEEDLELDYIDWEFILKTILEDFYG